MHGDTRMRGRGGPGLRGGNPVWSHVNCHIDLWIELLHGLDLPPVAALACAVRQDFEADHFTQCRFPDADLERLYGLTVHALTFYDSLESHVAAQTSRGHIVVMELDSSQLPPPRGAGYLRHCMPTCIAIDVLIPEAGAVGYYHSDGYHTATGEDYAAIIAWHRACAVPTRCPSCTPMWSAATGIRTLPRRCSRPRWHCCAFTWATVRARTPSQCFARYFPSISSG